MGAKFGKLKEQYDDLKEFTYSVIAKRDEYYHLLGNIYVASTELKGVPLSDLPVAVAAKFKRDRDRINKLENEKGDLLGELEERDIAVAALQKQLEAYHEGEFEDEAIDESESDEFDAIPDGFWDKMRTWQPPPFSYPMWVPYPPQIKPDEWKVTWVTYPSTTPNTIS